MIRMMKEKGEPEGTGGGKKVNMEKIGGGCAGCMKRQKKDEEADRNANRKLRGGWRVDRSRRGNA